MESVIKTHCKILFVSLHNCKFTYEHLTFRNFINRRPRSGRRLYLNPSHDVTINPHPIKIDQNRSKKSNFTCTLEHDQPPSDQKIRSKSIKTDQKYQKKIKFHLYTRARSTAI